LIGRGFLASPAPDRFLMPAPDGVAEVVGSAGKPHSLTPVSRR